MGHVIAFGALIWTATTTLSELTAGLAYLATTGLADLGAAAAPVCPVCAVGLFLLDGVSADTVGAWATTLSVVNIIASAIEAETTTSEIFDLTS